MWVRVEEIREERVGEEEGRQESLRGHFRWRANIADKGEGKCRRGLMIAGQAREGGSRNRPRRMRGNREKSQGSGVFLKSKEDLSLGGG